MFEINIIVNILFFNIIAISLEVEKKEREEKEKFLRFSCLTTENI